MQTLRSAMQLTGHINEDVVMALYLGNIAGEEKQRIREHVAECTGCSREFDLYREMLSGVETLVKNMGGPQHADRLRASIQGQLRQRQIYYDLFYHSHAGPMWIAATTHGVCMLQFSEHTPFEIEELLREAQSEAWIVRDKHALVRITTELRDYFQRRREHFSFAIDWRFVPAGFKLEVLQMVSKIPYGQVYTYGEIAERLGQPKAVRAVGQALAANPLPIFVPCHRVVAAGGKLGGFSAGPNLKRRLLELEGVRWPNFSRQMDLFARWS
ncbi:MAG: methylated-DNA--[protein]-cysteine S-methyltransferase [candidate division KSB1 bacterium]